MYSIIPRIGPLHTVLYCNCLYGSTEDASVITASSGWNVPALNSGIKPNNKKYGIHTIPLMYFMILLRDIQLTHVQRSEVQL
jgi:hypothetical protein